MKMETWRSTPSLKDHLKGAKEAGLDVGVYFSHRQRPLMKPDQRSEICGQTYQGKGNYISSGV